MCLLSSSAVQNQRGYHGNLQEELGGAFLQSLSDIIADNGSVFTDFAMVDESILRSST